MRRLAIALLAVSACSKKTSPGTDAASAAAALVPTAADAPAPPPAFDAAPAELRWVYEMKVMDDAGNAKEHEVTLVERGRKTVAGMTAIQLGVLLDGKPITDEKLEEVSGAPFTTFAASFTLLVGEKKKRRGVWLLFGATDKLDADVVKEALAEPPTWPLDPAARKKPEPAEGPSDEVFVYGKKIGAWDSVCTGYLHPAEESGDSYAWQKCFDPAAGITRLEFDSAWGGYELALTTAPKGFSLPP